jgi:hypothetical protein
MQVLGTDFKKIHLNRNSFEKNIELEKIEYNMKVSNIVEREFNLGTPTKILAFECELKAEYPLRKPGGKSLGDIDIVLDVIVHDPEGHKKILSDWKKKKVDPELMEKIMNVAFDLTMSEALYLSRKVLLPPPIRTPKLKFEEQKGKAG